ncbi:MAG: YjgP/YjgQ family permease [Nitrospirae bacterium]|nr:MAG: YjgP/YjgQ family permease [Nitrospirota bacterium]
MSGAGRVYCRREGIPNPPLTSEIVVGWNALISGYWILQTHLREPLSHVSGLHTFLTTLLERYIFRELLPPFWVSLAALCFIVFTKEMLRLVELLVAKGIGMVSVFKIILHLMPSFLVLTLPIAGLIASITAFGRLSSDKELIAMRAAGVSLFRISLPVAVFSSLVFALTVFFSQWGQPWSNISLKKLALSLIQDQLAVALDTGVFNNPVPGLMVYVPESPAGTPPAGIFIADQRDAAKSMVITAERFQFIHDPARTYLGLRLYNGTIHHVPTDHEQHHQASFQSYDLKLDFSEAFRIQRPERPSYDQILQKLQETHWRDTGALRRLMEYYKDVAFPVASFLLTMLGLPVGIVSKRSGRIAGMTIGIVIMVGYYLLNVLGEFFVTTLLLHPFAGAWLPDVVVLSIGIVLFYRLSRQ